MSVRARASLGRAWLSADTVHLPWLTARVSLCSLSQAQLMMKRSRSIVVTPSPPPLRPTLTLRWLEEQLPHIGAATRASLLEELKDISPRRLAVNSVEEVSFSVPAMDARAVELVSKVRAVDDATREVVSEITIDGETFKPWLLLSDDGGLRFNSTCYFRYRIASEEYVAEVDAANAKRDADIAHCEKLLRDLPVALRNSEQAMQTAMNDDPELSELGAMLVEQNRIKKEIDSQRTKLGGLQNTSPAQLDPSKFELRRHHNIFDLHFGYTHIGGKVYQLIQQPYSSSVKRINTAL